MNKSKKHGSFSADFNRVAAFGAALLARGGGGGSGGGGGGGGGGFGGSGSGGSGSLGLFGNIIVLSVLIIISVAGAYLNRKHLKAREVAGEKELEAEHVDAVALKTRTSEIFYAFQEAWSSFDLDAMKEVLSYNYYKRMVLELNVLKNEHRADIMKEVRLGELFIYDVQGDAVTMRVSATAQDSLMDTAEDRVLFYDATPFIEFWHLLKESGSWKLDLITQQTENASLVEGEITDFAKKNDFYFDPDFGWLMLPNKGVLFSSSTFGASDVNNHVIGYFRDKIVEFYTYIPRPNGANYLVSQAVLPRSYHNILIKRKGFFNFTPRGLRAITLESGEFNSHFRLFADPQDQVNSLELLSPNFMDKINGLPFDLNIEIVGNFLYFYTKDRGVASYDSMLEVLSWAFDEMKM
jgi:hypothetical protein